MLFGVPYAVSVSVQSVAVLCAVLRVYLLSGVLCCTCLSCLLPVTVLCVVTVAAVAVCDLWSVDVADVSLLHAARLSRRAAGAVITRSGRVAPAGRGVRRVMWGSVAAGEWRRGRPVRCPRMHVERLI